jgi:hypothetical protein
MDMLGFDNPVHILFLLILLLLVLTSDAPATRTAEHAEALAREHVPGA